MSRTLISSGSEFEEKIGYSRAVVAGNTVYVSGTTGYDYATGTISDDVAEQAAQALRNIAAALEKAGSSLDEVVRATYMLTDGNDFEACWPALRDAFSSARPACTMMQVPLMEAAMKIEIEVTAVIGSAAV